jgi:transposase
VAAFRHYRLHHVICDNAGFPKPDKSKTAREYLARWDHRVNRTAAGARAQGVLMSVLEACRRQTCAVMDYLSQSLRAFGNRLLPRPALLIAR